MIKFIDFFSGIGAFSLGFEQAGMTCVAQVEKDPHARLVLDKHFPNTEKFGDIRHVSGADLPSADVWCGGFPCQDVSVAGGRAGLAGERSGLWFEFLRLIKECSPRIVVIENVPGLLSSHKGRDFGTILQGLVEHGYSVCWRCLDSQGFGVAQRRKRVFIVASLGDGSSASILLESPSSAGHLESSREEAEAFADATGTGAPNDRIAGTLSASGAGTYRTGNSRSEIDMLAYNVTFGDSNGLRKDRPNGGLYINETTHANGLSTGAPREQTLIATRKTTTSESFDVRNLSINNEISGTLQSKNAGGYSLNYQNPVVIHDDDIVSVRRMTPLECERLMGFPDGWTLVISGRFANLPQDMIFYLRQQYHKAYGVMLDDDQVKVLASDIKRYKQLGNAVVVPVSEWIGKRIVSAIGGSHDKI